MNNRYNPTIIENIINKLSKKIKTSQSESETNSKTTEKYVPINKLDKITYKVGNTFKKTG